MGPVCARVCRALVLLAVLAGCDAALGAADAGRGADRRGAQQGRLWPDGGGDPLAGDGGVHDAGANAAPSGEALAAQCPARCAEAEPEPGNNPLDCPNGSVADCVKACQNAVADTDLPCAQCVLDGLHWQPAIGGCGEWECVCGEGYADFPSVQHSGCAEACASTLSRRAAERLAAPVPVSLGRAPDAVLAPAPFVQISALSAGGDGELWLGGVSRDVERSHGLLGRLSADGALGVSVEPEPAGLAPRLVAATDGAALVVAGAEGGVALSRYAPDGTRTLHAPLDAEQVAGLPLHLALTPAGNLLATLDARRAAVLSPAGSVLWSDGLVEPLGPTSPVNAVVPHGAERWVWGGAELDPGVVVQLEVGPDESAPSLTERWRVELVGNEGMARVQGVHAAADGHVVAFGWLRHKKRYGRGTLYYGAPFVARISPEGVLDWVWEHEGVVPGDVRAVTTNAAGDVYLTGGEDPVSYGPAAGSDEVLCTVYGCGGLVVRKLSAADGRLDWEYAHRERTSEGLALALDGEGRLFVGGYARREEQEPLLLRFDAP